MATYLVNFSNNGLGTNRATLTEQNIYGASRIGMRRKSIALYENTTVPYIIPDVKQNTLGDVAYEITNYLGNVNVVISDRKIYVPATGAFKACTLSRTDYFPFGMEISSRTTVGTYRFGYNGMEQDPEAKGEGNSYTTEFRQYDPRLGRWLSLDPLMAQFPWQSPYCAFDNNPVFFTDPTGLATEDWIGKKSEDGKSINWEYNKDVKSADQLPEGYTEFAENGTIINTKDGYGRLGEGKFIPMSDTDYKASQGVFEPGRYYRVGQFGWEESGMMLVDAVTSEMAATADFLASQNSYETFQQEQMLSSASLLRPFIEQEQRQLVYNYQMSQHPIGLTYMMSPFSAVPDVYGSIQEGSYYTAGGIALLEFTPWDDVSDLMRANKRAFARFKYNNSAGYNMDWHHLVEQNSVNVSRFGINKIQSSKNLIRLDKKIHWAVNSHMMSSGPPGFSRNRDYVKTLSYAKQRKYMISLLKENGWKP